MTDGRRITVLALSKGLGPGGAERLLVSFAAKIDRERFDLHAAYLLPWKDHLVAEMKALGVEATCLRGPRELDPRWVLRLRRLVHDERIDVVHVHSPLAAVMARAALRLTLRRRPVIIGTEHNVWSSHRAATRYANLLTMPLQDYTIAVSDEVRASMPRRLARRTEVVLHGVDVGAIRARCEEREAARHELGVGADAVLVATVANLRRNKDYPTLLHAAQRVATAGAPVMFVSVGQGPLEGELNGIRDSLGLGDQFRFLGYRADPVRVLAAADVFCLPSQYEGLPIALLEALAMGLPIVATRVGGVPSVITDRREGLLAPSGDPEALALALLTMVDVEQRSAYASRAAERASAFDIMQSVERLQTLYESLVVAR